MAEKIVIEVDVNTNNGEQAVKSLQEGAKSVKKEVNEGAKAIDGMTDSLDKMSGGAISAFKNFVSGAKSGVAAMNSLRLAIAATGIGALIVAIVSLKAAFTSSEEGQNRWAKIMGVISAIVGTVTELLADLGDLLVWVFTNPVDAIKGFADTLKTMVVNQFNGLLELIPKLGEAIGLLFLGKFKEAGKVATDAVGKVVLGVESLTDKISEASDKLSDFANKTADNMEKAARAADLRAKADLMERQMKVEQAEMETRISELRLKGNQTELYSAKERQEALRQAMELTDEMALKEQELLTLRRDALALENEIGKTGKEALDELADMDAALIRLDKRRLDSQRSMQRAMTSARREDAARAQKEAEDRINAIEEINAALRSGYEQELHENRVKYEKLIEQAKKYGQDVGALEAEMAKRAEAIRDKELERIAQIEKERQEKEQKEIDERLAVEREISRLFMSEREREEQDVREMYERLILEAEKYGEDTIALREKMTDELEAINQREIDNARKKQAAEVALAQAERDAKLAIAEQVANSVSALAGKQTEAGKAAAIAATTISTYQAAAKSLAQYGATPIGLAAVAASIVSGLAQVKSILSVQVPGGGGSGSTAGSSFSAPSVGQSIGLINPVGVGSNISTDISQELNEKPIRAYVTTGDVESGAALNRKIRAAGEFA